MKNLIKVISNQLESTRIVLEDKLDNIVNSKELTIEEKKELVVELLGEIAVSEISLNLWQGYLTPRPQEGEEANPPESEGPQQENTQE